MEFASIISAVDKETILYAIAAIAAIKFIPPFAMWVYLEVILCSELNAEQRDELREYEDREERVNRDYEDR